RGLGQGWRIPATVGATSALRVGYRGGRRDLRPGRGRSAPPAADPREAARGTRPPVEPARRALVSRTGRPDPRSARRGGGDCAPARRPATARPGGLLPLPL